MIEEALPGTTPIIDSKSGPGDKTQNSAESQAGAKKNVASKTGGKGASKQQRLISHLVIGFLMAVIAIAGYALLGPHARVSAADQVGSHFVDVTPNLPLQGQNTGVMDSSSQWSDLAAMQAQMNQIMSQMNALKAENSTMPSSINHAGSQSISGMSGYNTDPVSAKLDQMNAMMNDLMDQMNAMNAQGSSMNSSAGGTGHNGHH